MSDPKPNAKGEFWIEGKGGFRVCGRCGETYPLEDYPLGKGKKVLASGEVAVYTVDRRTCLTCRREIRRRTSKPRKKRAS
jgi:hypothetical protein